MPNSKFSIYYIYSYPSLIKDITNYRRIKMRIIDDANYRCESNARFEISIEIDVNQIPNSKFQYFSSILL
ncbi:unnamed protein product [Rhizophagus irregularis]|nr:unnamed protein product [Rhizophagus irregularis]